MAKSYGISKGSDMKRFSRNSKKALREKTEQTVQQRAYVVECPLCKQRAMFQSGTNVCPHCGKTVDIKLIAKKV